MNRGIRKLQLESSTTSMMSFCDVIYFACDKFDNYYSDYFLDKQNGGDGWANYFISRESFKKIISYDTFDTYTIDSTLSGQNNGIGGWSGSYIVH